MNPEDLHATLKAIASLRKEGDGMQKLHKPEVARQKWMEALGKAESVVPLLSAENSPADCAEVYGVRAALFKRLGDDQSALESYHKGAEIETEAGLGSTYNRMNEIRAALLLNSTTIQGLEPNLKDIAKVLEKRLNDPKDTEASSDGWLWADFGDVCTLRGNVAEAEKYYRAFVRIAGGSETRITRDTLELLLKRVTEANDPDADRIRAGLAALARATSLSNTR
jgi:tetratricopeptide (TPR) repeat protein